MQLFIHAGIKDDSFQQKDPGHKDSPHCEDTWFFQ